jgi:hypothetical protein
LIDCASCLYKNIKYRYSNYRYVYNITAVSYIFKILPIPVHITGTCTGTGKCQGWRRYRYYDEGAGYLIWLKLNKYTGTCGLCLRKKLRMLPSVLRISAMAHASTNSTMPWREEVASTRYGVRRRSRFSLRSSRSISVMIYNKSVISLRRKNLTFPRPIKIYFSSLKKLSHEISS